MNRLLPRTLVLILFSSVLGGSTAKANGELRGVLGEFAGELKKVLESQGESAIAIGQFSGPANFPTSAGPGIAQVLTEELSKKSVQVKARAKYGVKGNYRLTEVPAEDPDDRKLGRKVLATEIEATVVDQFDKPLGDIVLKRQIRGEATLLQLSGVPVALPTNGNQTTERERDQEMRRGLVESKPAIADGMVRTKPASPYAMEILVKDKSRPVEDKDGLPYVQIRRSEEYAIRLLNDSPYEAAVQLHIDGLSLFQFSEVRQPEYIKDDKGVEIVNPRKGEPRYSVVILPPKANGKPGEAIIRGWHVTNQATDKFVVTEYAKSAAGSLNHTANLGTITATFQAAWEKDPPPDEPGRRRGGMGDATGRGDRIGQEYHEVVRKLGVIRDCISIRYTKGKE